MANEKNIRIGDVLLQAGYINQNELDEALEYQKNNKGIRLGEALIKLGFITEHQQLEALSARLGQRYVKIDRVMVQTEAVAMIPVQLAKKYHMLAVQYKDNNLTIVLNDPLDYYGIEDIRQTTGMNLEIWLTELLPLNQAIEYYYSEIEAKKAASSANEMAREREQALEVNADEGDSDAPVIKLLDNLLARAFSMNASDIHIEPFEEKTSVRIRVDGQLLDYVVLQKSLHQNLIARVKILGQMDIAEKRLPQDGHFRTRIANRDVNIRTSVIPTVFGEKAVLRLLASGNMVADAETFGMNQAHFEQFSKMLEAPNGMIYITGPTGSGKTTTLYMALQKLSNRKVNIATIEDPVEWNIPRVNQCQVNTVAGLTFERGLRSLLRQDPDIIMVGETRDEETAAISVRAAITGHLVFSTLHTNDAVSSIIRLIDMGVEPYMVANSIVGLVAQRLVRVVCPECGYWDEPTKAFIGPKIKRVRRAQGCNSCSHTGYVGRRAIHEILCVDNQMRRMITQRTPMDELRSYATHYLGMESLTDEALKLVADGTTTVEELKKVAYYI